MTTAAGANSTSAKLPTNSAAPSTPSASTSRPSAPVGTAPSPNPAQGATNGAATTSRAVNGSAKNKKKAEQPVDPAVMYESLKSRIAALEEEEVHEEEEERRIAEEAQQTVRGLEETVVHAKYVELFAEMKRTEREHSKEKQKLTKDKDAAKGQLTKANQTKTKMENLARELQKDNKRLREDTKRLTASVDDAQSQLRTLKEEMDKRMEPVRVRERKPTTDATDVVVKVVCKYRAELYFKISRKTKLSRLFNAWTERMESPAPPGSGDANGTAGGKKGGTQALPASTSSASSVPASPSSFIFTHDGHSVDAEQTPEELSIEEGDEILAVELMDLTRDEAAETAIPQPVRQRLKKNWSRNREEATRTLEEVFDGVVRQRLKSVLRQYELREKHFECVVRSKELEVLLSRARAAEQKQVSEQALARTETLDAACLRLKTDLEHSQNAQKRLIEKLIACSKEPNMERTQRLFASLREELEKRATTADFGPGQTNASSATAAAG